MTDRLSALAAEAAVGLSELSPARAKAMEAMLLPAIRKELRDWRRRVAVMEAASFHHGGALKRYPIAEVLHVALLRYAAAGWRLEEHGPEPADHPARAALWRVLRLTRGRVLGVTQLARHLKPTSAGVAMSMKKRDDVRRRDGDGDHAIHRDQKAARRAER